MSDTAPERSHTEDIAREEAGSGRSGLVVALVIFILLTLACLAILGLNEYGENPMFGKAKEYKEAATKTAAENEALKQRNAELEEANARYAENMPGEEMGIFYEVQIGAFEHFDLGKYNEELDRLQIERTDGLKKYILARFRSRSRAERFLRDMHKLGIPDAFIIARVDGNRMTIEEAELYAQGRR